jgi:hypothetical protein
MKNVIPSLSSRPEVGSVNLADSSYWPTLRSSGDMILPSWKYHALSRPKACGLWKGYRLPYAERVP